MYPHAAVQTGVSAAARAGIAAEEARKRRRSTMSESRPEAHPDEPDAITTSLDAAEEIEFEWARKLREAGHGLTPDAERRAAARQIFLDTIAEVLDDRRTASHR